MASGLCPLSEGLSSVLQVCRAHTSTIRRRVKYAPRSSYRERTVIGSLLVVLQEKYRSARVVSSFIHAARGLSLSYDRSTGILQESSSSTPVARRESSSTPGGVRVEYRSPSRVFEVCLQPSSRRGFGASQHRWRALSFEVVSGCFARRASASSQSRFVVVSRDVSLPVCVWLSLWLHRRVSREVSREGHQEWRFSVLEALGREKTSPDGWAGGYVWVCCMSRSVLWGSRVSRGVDVRVSGAVFHRERHTTCDPPGGSQHASSPLEDEFPTETL